MLLYVNWNETTNIWRNFRSFHNIMYKCSCSKDWRTNNALAPRFSEIKDNNLRLYACQIKDRQYQRSTLEVKDEQIRLSFDAWGQGLTDEQHVLYIHVFLVEDSRIEQKSTQPKYTTAVHAFLKATVGSGLHDPLVARNYTIGNIG